MAFISNIFGYLLNFLYEFFNNYGIAIIVFSIVLRIILIPITIKQQKAMIKNGKMQKKMQEIQKKYKNNPEKLNQETIELYKREKMSPFSGCLSSILQIVIILSVFWLVSQPLTYMKKIDPEIINTYKEEIKEEGKAASYPEINVIQTKGAEDERVNLNMDFLGVDLSKVLTQSLNDPRVYIIPILYVITSFISTKMTTNMQNGRKKEEEKEIIVSEGNKEEKQPDEIDAMQQMNKSMSYMLPIMSISIAIIAPLGLALYWLISNILMIIERLIINKVMKSKGELEDA